MSKEPPPSEYVARIEGGEGGYRAVVSRDGITVFDGAVRPRREAARLEAAEYVLGRPEQRRTLRWEDPFANDPADEGPDDEGEIESSIFNPEWTRNFVRSNPRIKEEGRRLVFAALDTFEALVREREISREQLAAVVAAARSPLRAAWEVGGTILSILAASHPAAQSIFSELLASRSAKERLRAVVSLSARMPRALLVELLSGAIKDRGKRVRVWAGEMCNKLNLQEMVPRLLLRAQAEADPDVRRSLELNAGLLRDGYLIEQKGGSRPTLYIRLRGGGLTSRDVSRRDVQRGRVPAIVAEVLSKYS